MQVKTDHYGTAVCVARLQVPELHEAHEDLIQTLLNGEITRTYSFDEVRANAALPVPAPTT